MSNARQDAAASAPPEHSAGRGPLRRWLGRLADIAGGLTERMTRAAAFRRANPAASASVDLDLARALVTRAVRWIGALQARFMAEVKAAAQDVFVAGVKAVSEGRPSRDDRPEPWPARRAPKACFGGIPPDRCIAGKTSAEVVAQICADLGAAATLLRGRLAAQQIAAIAAAARALLAGPDAAWTARPAPGARKPALDEGPPAMALAAAAAVPLFAPDTG